jgi:hypothetical protein
MATNRTFKGAIKPMGASGHFNESQRHSMQAKGFKTGHLSTPWNVYLHGEKIDTVFYNNNLDKDYVKRGLIDHDGYDPSINIRRDKKSFLKDSDHDGVPDKDDCSPHDPNRQHSITSIRAENGMTMDDHDKGIVASELKDKLAERSKKKEKKV